jgi:hypothetical protein
MRNWSYPTASENPPSVEFYSQLYQNSIKDGKAFETYSTEMEYAHGVLHNLVGGKRGHMNRVSLSPLDPIFYAHHSHIDYLFHRAQLGWVENSVPGSYALSAKMSDGTIIDANFRIPGHPNVTVGDVLDLDTLCIRYAPFGEVVQPQTPAITSTSAASRTATVTTTRSSLASSTSTPSASPTGKPYLPPGYDPSANFTLDLPQDWANMSFGVRANEVKDRASQIADEVKNKVNSGETIDEPPRPKYSKKLTSSAPVLLIHNSMIIIFVSCLLAVF